MPEITEVSLSRAWQRAALLANSSPRKEVTNLVVSIEGLGNGAPEENEQLRTVLDQSLELNGKFPVSTVASTIFPRSLWNPSAPRIQLYERYMRLWPRIVSCPNNRRGTYFQRLISYPVAEEPTFNQLEFVISAFTSGTRRRSALQCGILNPPIDLNPTPYQGFPCMQQISFHKEGASGLRVSALYPMHYLWARAYGNYLGIINLGRFMAKEMSLTLEAITCVALVAKLDNPTIAAPLLRTKV
jgi:hypothetical protein